MRKSLVVAMACVFAALTLGGCASTAAAAFTPSSAPTKRDFSAPLESSGGGNDFHIMRSEQLRNIPTGSSIGVISTGSAGLPLFVEADFEAKGLTVRQIDIYNLMSPREKSLTDPADDFAYINDLIGVIAKNERPDKENVAASVDKLLPADKLDLENQLVDHYLGLYQNLKKMVASLNVDYLVIVGPVYKELSYAMRIYDATKLDLVYTCLFVGAVSEWRTVIGTPQKTMNLSYYYKSGSEPTAYWELAFSKFAIDRIKIGSGAAASTK
jgi:hypothetical protein